MTRRARVLLLWMLVAQVGATGVLQVVVRHDYLGGYFGALPWFALLLAGLCVASFLLGVRLMAFGTPRAQLLYQLLSLGRIIAMAGLVVVGFIYWPTHRWAIASLAVASYIIMLTFTTLACSPRLAGRPTGRGQRS